MDMAEVDAYLTRIGADRPARADVESLRDLHLCHLLAVPFENLSIHLGEPVVLEQGALVEKIVHRRRGGFCYELNGTFAALLSALGFHVTLLAARAFGRDGLGPPFDHLTLRVNTPEPWLVDVGFGRHSHYPLRLDGRGEQREPGGVFHIVESQHGDVDVIRDGEPQYRIESRPRVLADFDATCWWHQTSPRSHFTQSLVCSLLTESGRITLSDHLLIRTIGSDRYEHVLANEDEVLDALRTSFGIDLDRTPSLEAAKPR